MRRPTLLLIVGDNLPISGGFTLTSTTDEVVAVDTGNVGNNFSSTTVLSLLAIEGVLVTANTSGSTGALTINSALTGTIGAGSPGLTVGGSGALNLAGRQHRDRQRRFRPRATSSSGRRPPSSVPWPTI